MGWEGVMTMSGTLTNLLVSAALLLGMYLAMRLLRRLFRKFAKRHDYGPGRVFQVQALGNALIVLITLILLGLVWGFSGQGFVVFASSLFAIIGIALFASWSILSNLTAGLILFFGAPFRLADRVRVLDGDNTVTGRVVQMGLIYLGLEDDDGHFYTLPNNVLLQKTVIRLKAGKELPADKKHCR
jgi:small-conductance mechanosensitive channel